MDNKKQASCLEILYQKVRDVIEQSRTTVYQTINSETLHGYWKIGRYIVEEEQKGKKRAMKGDALIKNLAFRLTAEYKSGFDYSNVKRMKQFYITYPKGDALRVELSWTHYRILIRVHNKIAREFYMEEAIKSHWGTRTLERSILNKFYERTLLAQQHEISISSSNIEIHHNEVEQIYTPQEFIKDPYNLSFTGLTPQLKHQEKDIEQALMNKLQDFILELGRGFAFVGRQYRINIGKDNFYIDLVFYNYLLKCFLIIDLKTTKLNHQDIGQMDFYVRYFEKKIKQKNDNPTIGLILCTDKNNEMVKYTLLDDSKNIFASKYHFYLPPDELLTKALTKEKERIEKADPNNS